MDLLLLLHAVVLGIVEGLTEFLPISSTGHLIIAGDLIGFSDERAKAFEIFIQLGAVLGVVWLYRQKVISIALGLGNKPAQRFVLNLFIAFLPAAVVGLLAHKYIKAYLFSPFTVAAALVVGGIVILAIERRPHPGRVQTMDAMTPLDAFKVGCAQTLALFPGVSRAGATIMGGIVFGLARTTATEFSFFLAMPTMLAATVFELYKSRDYLSTDDIGLFAVGFVTAFITAVIVVRLFLGYVAHHTFAAFAWYRIVFGLAVLAYYW